VHPADEAALEPDAWAHLMEWRRNPPFHHQHHLGVTSDAWVWSNPETSTLVLGPPRSVGKTSACLVPVVLSAVGPVVSTSTKLDIARATAVCRARQGKLWHFAPDGTATPPGFEVLRWSPITMSQEWDPAVAIGRQLVEMSDITQATRGSGSSSDVGHHFGELASSLIACLLFFAANHSRDMDWVADVIATRDIYELEYLHPQLAALDPRAGNRFKGLTWVDPRTRASTYQTASVALRAYELRGALESASDPNFDVKTFIKTSDTVYITSSSKNQKLVAGIIACFLNELRDATYERHRKDATTGRALMRPPVTLVLDELANIVPWPELPDVLTEGGSQGLQTIGALQSLAQARQRWGDAIGSDFLTLFNNVIALPGIRDQETLETLSILCGEFDRQQWGESYPETPDIRQAHPSRTLSYTRQRRVPPNEISNGHPQSPDIALALIHLSGPAYLYVTPYYASPPWTHCLVRSVQYIVKHQPELTVLPLPELDREGRGVYGTLARMGLWHDWSLVVPRYLDQRALNAPLSGEHDDLLIWITEPSSDVLWEILVDEFEHDGVIIFPEPGPIVLPGEDWRRSAMIVRDGPTDDLFVIDAHSLWETTDQAVRKRVTTKLGTEPGQHLWVHYRLDTQDCLQRLYAALAVHCSVYSERPSDAVGSDRTD
jgi:hypothetical protein